MNRGKGFLKNRVIASIPVSWESNYSPKNTLTQVDTYSSTHKGGRVAQSKMKETRDSEHFLVPPARQRRRAGVTQRTHNPEPMAAPLITQQQQLSCHWGFSFLFYFSELTQFQTSAVTQGIILTTRSAPNYTRVEILPPLQIPGDQFLIPLLGPKLLVSAADRILPSVCLWIHFRVLLVQFPQIRFHLCRENPAAAADPPHWYSA